MGEGWGNGSRALPPPPLAILQYLVEYRILLKCTLMRRCSSRSLRGQPGHRAVRIPKGAGKGATPPSPQATTTHPAASTDDILSSHPTSRMSTRSCCAAQQPSVGRGSSRLLYYYKYNTVVQNI